MSLIYINYETYKVSIVNSLSATSSRSQLFLFTMLALNSSPILLSHSTMKYTTTLRSCHTIITCILATLVLPYKHYVLSSHNILRSMVTTALRAMVTLTSTYQLKRVAIKFRGSKQSREQNAGSLLPL